jgi:periplasmic protein TonB
MTFGNERLDQGIIFSVVLHGALFTLVILSPKLFPSLGTTWGSPTGGTGGISVKITSSVSGVPLPAPPVVQESAPANDSPGFYKSEEAAPPPPPDPTADEIPETKAPIKKPPDPKTAPPAPKSPPAAEPAPANAVPYGQGGRPALAYGQFSTGAGAAGVGFGDAAFGDKYGTYVDAMTRRISQNWLKSLVDNRVTGAPRVYLGFEIARDGTISNVEVKQSSGIPSLDRSAQRAILASNPLPPLPADYRGSGVTVNFYFEYSK